MASAAARVARTRWLAGKRRLARAPSVAGLTLLLGACSLAPPLKVPEIPIAPAYKELTVWTEARPADRLPRDQWWSLYETAEIDTLEQRLIAGIEW